MSKEDVENDKKKGNKWVLCSSDEKKKLGEFKTKKEALKKEKEIQYFKNK